MKILFIGDIVGKPGRTLVQSAVLPLVSHYGIDLVVANVENAAGGNGITPNRWFVLRFDGGHGAGAISPGAWYHVAAVRSGNEFAIYLDGAKVDELCGANKEKLTELCKKHAPIDSDAAAAE